MRVTAMFAVVLTTVLFGVAGSTASAQELATSNSKQTEFVSKVLLATANESDTKTASKEVEPAKPEAPKPEEKPAETAPAEPAAPQPVIAIVQSGDSLSSIAAAHGTTWVRLYNANTGIVDPNIINPGQQVRIPDATEQLQDRALPQPKPVANSAPTATTTRTTSARKVTPAATSYPISANAAKAFIYAHESGNNPNATNPNGCYGLGQDCNGRLRTLCGADYACQDAFFDRYAVARYGSWEGAYAFWLAHHWW